MTKGQRAVTFLNKAMEFMQLAQEEMEGTELAKMIEELKAQTHEKAWDIDPDYN